MSDTRVVLISGPRQAGKTTLASDIASDEMPFRDLDDGFTLQYAKSDPTGFIRGLDRAVIDEIQRVPDLLLAIKKSVDNDQRSGRFLLTGSANLMTIPTVADSLAGRMETIQIRSLSQSEIVGKKSCFIDRAFRGEEPQEGKMIVGDELIETVLFGGYPGAIKRTKWERKRSWHQNYLESIVQRDIRDVSQIEQSAIMPRLLTILAEHSGQLVNYSRIGASLGLNHVTARKYIHIFEDIFLIHPLEPWFSNRLKRLAKSPKLHFLDSGLHAAMCNLSPAAIKRDRSKFGPVLETFVFSELQKIAGWSKQRCLFSHFRDKEKDEVDIVLENSRREVVGIEVKASGTLSVRDFSGLCKLKKACGQNFIQGLVLYDHDQIVPFDEDMYGAPLSCLWSD